MGPLDAVLPNLQSPELLLEKDGESVFLTSSRFEAMTSRDDVMALAQRALALIEAAARLAGVRPMPIQANRVEEQTTDGPRSTTYVHALSMSAVIGLPTPTIVIGGQPPPPPLAIPVEVGLRDSRAARALEFFAREPNWYDLYKVLDVIEEDVGGEKALANKGWVSRSELKRFTATANNLATLGPDARHAIDAWKPPASPMTLDDAVSTIGRILSAWLATK